MPRETTKAMVALKLQVDLPTGIRLLGASTGMGWSGTIPANGGNLSAAIPSTIRSPWGSSMPNCLEAPATAVAALVGSLVTAYAVFDALIF